MNSDLNLQNNNQANIQYTPGGYDRANIKKLLLIVVGVFFAITILVLVVSFQSKPESQQSKYTKSATLAARKNTPNAKVTNIKVAKGFAIALVSDPTSQGQSNAGNTTIFKVNKDGSMNQLAEGSSFSPLDLLGLGMPLATQAELTGSNIKQVKQNLANQCGYSNGATGFTGFNGSFSPGDWQIDSSTLIGLEQKISSAITNQDANMKSNMAVICISATPKNSNYTINKTTFISTFSLQVQFITSDGTLTTHTVTFAVGPNYYRSYTLDGHDI
jgi:hypothetical protein